MLLRAVFPNLKLFLGQQQSASITYYYFNQQHGDGRGAMSLQIEIQIKSTMTQIEEIEEIILNVVFTDI